MMVATTDTSSAGLAALLRRWGLLLLIVAAVVLRLALTPLYANLPDGLLDEGFWMHWMDRIHQHGVLNIFRESDTDYVGYHWVLWLLDLGYSPFGTRYDAHSPGLHFLVKVPPIIFDVVLIVTVYYTTKTLVDREPAAQRDEPSWLPLIAAGVIAFQPGVVYDSAVWAQTDAAIAAAMLGALLLVHRDAHAAAVGAVGAVVGAVGFEDLARRVGDEQRESAGTAVHERRRDGVAQVAVGHHVVDGVVHEHGVEHATESDRPHVAGDVFALGVDAARDLEHVVRQVDERHREFGLHVHGVVASATTELENLTHRDRRLTKEVRGIRRFLDVLIRW